VTFKYRLADPRFSHQAIEGGLRNQSGIHSIEVALMAERGVIEYDPALWTVDKLIGVRFWLKRPDSSL
jgi:hypothetical protein